MGVEDVVVFAAQLEVDFFVDVEVLVNGPVEIGLPVQPEHVTAERAEIAQQRLREAEALGVIADRYTIHEAGATGCVGRSGRLGIKAGDVARDVGDVVDGILGRDR